VKLPAGYQHRNLKRINVAQYEAQFRVPALVQSQAHKLRKQTNWPNNLHPLSTTKETASCVGSMQMLPIQTAVRPLRWGMLSVIVVAWGENCKELVQIGLHIARHVVMLLALVDNVDVRSEDYYVSFGLRVGE